MSDPQHDSWQTRHQALSDAFHAFAVSSGLLRLVYWLNGKLGGPVSPEAAHDEFHAEPDRDCATCRAEAFAEASGRDARIRPPRCHVGRTAPRRTTAGRTTKR